MDNYELEVVYNKLSDIQKLEIMTMWVSNQAVPLDVAQQRVNHVVCVIKHVATNKIVGVSTALVKQLPYNQSLYYFYGMFIAPEHRGRTIPHRQPWIVATTVETLRRQNNRIKGVIAVLENQRIPDRLLLKQGFKQTNKLNINNRVFYLNFDGSELE